jgi:hypothetical protein
VVRFVITGPKNGENKELYKADITSREEGLGMLKELLQYDMYCPAGPYKLTYYSIKYPEDAQPLIESEVEYCFCQLPEGTHEIFAGYALF